jgi:hypothetical protein
MCVKKVAPTYIDFDEIWCKKGNRLGIAMKLERLVTVKKRPKIFSLWLPKRWSLWDESWLIGTLYILHIS